MSAAFQLHPEAIRAAEAVLHRWRSDPVLFAWEALGIWCWRKQRQMLRLMAKRDLVAVRSSQKTGKTMTIVILALWWLITKPQGRVFVTSSDYRNVKKVFWAELRGVLRRARIPFGGRLADDPQTGYTLADGRGIVGFSADKAEAWGGYSGPENLFIVDEGSAITQDLFEAIDGNRAGGGSLCMVGNPTQNSGPFFDAFHMQALHWARLHISSFDTPAFTGEKCWVRSPGGRWRETSDVPGLANKAHVEERARRYGKAHPFYFVRVLGEFAPNSDTAIVPLHLVSQAQEAYLRGKDNGGYIKGFGRLTLGVDPARFGADYTALAVRRGRRVMTVDRVEHARTLEIVGHVVEAVRKWERPDDEEIPRVNVDGTGGWGAGVVDALLDLKRPNGHPLVEVCELNSSECADDEDVHNNMRTQLLFGVREWLEDGPCALPYLPSKAQMHDMMGADLAATLYSYDARGRRRAEPKDEVKERLGRSPDLGDAVALSVYAGGSATPARRAGGVRRAGAIAGASPDQLS